MGILAINIPTYERLDSFSELMGKIEAELNCLTLVEKEQIEVNVFDNNSETSLLKQNFCEKIKLQSSVNITFRKNNRNIGGDRNILQCCIAGSGAKFTWVLGDDDHILNGSIKNILDILTKNQDSLGLLLLFDQTYFIKRELYDYSPFCSYFDFASNVIKKQPHLLIAHTLISCNIFRTDIFAQHEAEYVLNILTPRQGLRANFVHMRGIVSGLLHSEKAYSVILPELQFLDTSRRFPSDNNFESEIYKIYYFYFHWLMGELGVKFKDVDKDPALWWVYGADKPPFLRSLILKVRNILRRFFMIFV